MKKIITFLLSFVLILSSSSLVFAASNNKDNDDFRCKILTKEQFIQRLSEVENISLEEAAKRVENSNEKNNIESEGTVSPLAYTYGEYYVQESIGAGYKIEVGALMQMAEGGGHSQFYKVESTWSEAVGSGSYDWDHFYKQATILNAGQLRLATRGNIVVKVDTSTTAGANFGSKLIGAGFEVSATQNKTTYYRKTASVSKVKTLSWWKQ